MAAGPRVSAASAPRSGTTSTTCWSCPDWRRRLDSSEAAQEAEPAGRNTPGWLTQWSIQAARDLNRKLKNRQYLLINLLEAPILAILLAVLLRATERGGAYSFGASQNIPHFLFVSVIVAIFGGLTVSVEELFRDRLMRKREANLHLDWSAYLTAKCAVLFGISAIQTTLFALFATLILQLPGHFLAYTFTLFSVVACANLFGLIMSLLFNSVRVIYLAIPLFIIPQRSAGPSSPSARCTRALPRRRVCLGPPRP